jgi:predicted transcriptional regulator
MYSNAKIFWLKFKSYLEFYFKNFSDHKGSTSNEMQVENHLQHRLQAVVY